MSEDDLKMATKIQRVLSMILRTDVFVCNGKRTPVIKVGRRISFGVSCGLHNDNFSIYIGDFLDSDLPVRRYTHTFDYSVAGFAFCICLITIMYLELNYRSMSYTDALRIRRIILRLLDRLPLAHQTEVMVKLSDMSYIF